MILPGHIAASVLCHRHARADLRVALVAGIFPDVVDKLLYYGLGLVPSSRTPTHTLVAWLGSTLVVAVIAWLFHRVTARSVAWSWLVARSWPVARSWLVAYGAHLLCDSPLVGGKLPFLWPWLAHEFSSAHMPFGFLFGLDRWPIATLFAEAALVAFTLWEGRRRRVPVARPVTPALSSD
jgi:hypothetical protein